MKYGVYYYTKTNNTKKIADAIASELGVVAHTTENIPEENIEILFLGSSVYAAGVSGEVKNFIENLNANKVGKIVNFSTAALVQSTYNQIKKLAEKRGIKVDDEEFHCRGSFKIMHKGRPNEDDIKNAKLFAKKFKNINSL